jgi:hypothetical protein
VPNIAKVRAYKFLTCSDALMGIENDLWASNPADQSNIPILNIADTLEVRADRYDAGARAIESVSVLIVDGALRRFAD